MPYSTAGKNRMLDALGATRVSLHTASPGDTGTNEVTGGTYARGVIAYAAASGGVIDDTTNGVDINVPAGTTVTHVGFWDDSPETFLGYVDVPDEVYNQAGVYRVTNSTLDLNS